MVISKIRQIPRQKITELQHSKEFLEKVNPTVVRQAFVITADFEISWQILHSEESLTSG